MRKFDVDSTAQFGYIHPLSMIIASNPHESIAQLGECRLIDRIGQWLGPVSPPSPEGIGDDCAVLEPPLSGKQIVTTDSISYGQHFDDSVSAKAAGAKLIKRNLSDIAAMGGTPGPAVLALLMGPDISILWLQHFFDGVCEVCRQHDVHLVGGDISGLAPGNFSAVLTLTGTTATPRLRHTAGLGDHIYVTGTLGGSILQKHYAFEPRLAEGRWIAAQPECSAMMDLTDGLGKDLQALLPEACSAAIELTRIPIAEDAQRLAQNNGVDPMKQAFCDGEDYELLFTIAADSECEAFERRWAAQFPNLPLSRIGTFIPKASQGVFMDASTNAALPWTHGFEHLKQ